MLQESRALEQTAQVCEPGNHIYRMTTLRFEARAARTGQAYHTRASSTHREMFASFCLLERPPLQKKKKLFWGFKQADPGPRSLRLTMEVAECFQIVEAI